MASVLTTLKCVNEQDLESTYINDIIAGWLLSTSARYKNDGVK